MNRYSDWWINRLSPMIDIRSLLLTELDAEMVRILGSGADQCLSVWMPVDSSSWGRRSTTSKVGTLAGCWWLFSCKNDLRPVIPDFGPSNEQVSSGLNCLSLPWPNVSKELLYYYTRISCLRVWYDGMRVEQRLDTDSNLTCIEQRLGTRVEQHLDTDSDFVYDFNCNVFWIQNMSYQYSDVFDHFIRKDVYINIYLEISRRLLVKEKTKELWWMSCPLCKNLGLVCWGVDQIMLDSSHWHFLERINCFLSTQPSNDKLTAEADDINNTSSDYDDMRFLWSN